MDEYACGVRCLRSSSVWPLLTTTGSGPNPGIPQVVVTTTPRNTNACCNCSCNATVQVRICGVSACVVRRYDVRRAFGVARGSARARDQARHHPQRPPVITICIPHLTHPRFSPKSIQCFPLPLTHHPLHATPGLPCWSSGFGVGVVRSWLWRVVRVRTGGVWLGCRWVFRCRRSR